MGKSCWPVAEIEAEDMIELLRHGRADVLVAQSVVDAERTGDFPIVLRVEIICVVTKMGLRSADSAAHVGGVAEQEIGDRIAGSGGRVAVGWITAAVQLGPKVKIRAGRCRNRGTRAIGALPLRISASARRWTHEKLSASS